MAAGAAAAYAAFSGLLARPPGGHEAWGRRNARDLPVTLLEGPAYAAAAALGVALAPGVAPRARAAGLLAVASAGALGAYDDLAGSGDDRGLRGHLAALRRGRVTTGAAKLAGLGVAGLGAGALLRAGRDGSAVDALLAGGVIAGTANLANLLDLRPGRALKAGLIAGAPALVRGGAPGALVAGPLGAALAMLPADLGERSMLGDAGANALGAALGLSAAAGASRRSLGVRLAVVAGLTLASERVSFTRVIAATPGLRELDALGRRA
ncbi:hypothetical protein G9H71_10645 [Motilibacter sp. E257]|uniref:UDP-N-acetylmuramyl pentapeptide phosphotransferase/UDP-N-acetylglucosamine-1-phosphate transferase n=1 Tax=Motilibacter deserti TaxID=2714956 RepID=A0ABX0GYC2_9ACTN|nr:hypothetical protein [Motilibacter deserti]